MTKMTSPCIEGKNYLMVKWRRLPHGKMEEEEPRKGKKGTLTMGQREMKEEEGKSEPPLTLPHGCFATLAVHCSCACPIGIRKPPLASERTMANAGTTVPHQGGNLRCEHNYNIRFLVSHRCRI